MCWERGQLDLGQRKERGCAGLPTPSSLSVGGGVRTGTEFGLNDWLWGLNPGSGAA